MNITVFRVYQLNLLTAISMYMKSLFYLFLSIVGAWLFRLAQMIFWVRQKPLDLDRRQPYSLIVLIRQIS